MGSAEMGLVRSVYEAVGRGDVPAAFANMSEDVDWYECEGLPYGGHYRGPGQVGERVFGPLYADFPDFSVTPEEFLDQDSTVAVVVRYRGTSEHTKASLDQPAVHLWDVRHGEIVRFRQFVDTVKFREVVGSAA